MKNKLLLITGCLLILIAGCRTDEGQQFKNRAQLTMADDLGQTLDEISFAIVNECRKYGNKRLVVPALFSADKRKGFLAEEIVSRLYANPRLNTFSYFDVTARKKDVVADDFLADSPLLAELKADALLEINFLEEDQALFFKVGLFSYPQKKKLFEESYQITDKSSPVAASIINADYGHPVSFIGAAAWQEDFNKKEISVGKKYGKWFVQNGQYTSKGLDDTLLGNMALMIAPAPRMENVIFEGDCTLSRDSEGGLMLKGQSTPDSAVYVLFSAKTNKTGFVLRQPDKGDDWLKPPIDYPFPVNRPFHFKAVMSKRDFILFLDGKAITKAKSTIFGEGSYGVYINVKSGFPVLWDNLRLSK